MYGIGKKKALQFLRAQYGIENLGKTDPNISWETIENASIKFVCGLYGGRGNKDLTDMHHKKWIEKYKANTISSVLDLKYFPQTLEAIRLNVKRAHFQCYLWRNVKVARAVELKVGDFGWTKDTTSNCLELPPLEPTMPIAPNLLLKITFCGCCSAQPCSSNRYSCKKSTV